MSSGITQYEALRLERRGHVAVVTLNRQEKLNALNHQLTGELHAALDEVAGEFPHTRVLILTGAGRGFCSGADVGDLGQALAGAEESPSQGVGTEATTPSSIMLLAPHIRQIPQPTIAAVNGVAAGAGLSIALVCDLRLASETARFSCIFVKRSLVPDTASSHTIAALAGPGIAAEMALTGRIYDANWAHRAGLVGKLVPPDQLMEETLALAEEIASNPPIAVRAIKQLLYKHGPSLDRVIQAEHEANAPARGSEDQREAVLSFIERRRPVYKGR